MHANEDCCLSTGSSPLAVIFVQDIARNKKQNSTILQKKSSSSLQNQNTEACYYSTEHHKALLA
jgi:hypothetical protein